MLLASLFFATVTSVPYLRAGLEPPPGTRFVGFFYYIDDAYNYLSFTQQAEDGAFLFRNKMLADDHAPALVNLEWWAVGTLSRALGRRPALAYRLFGIAATVALFAAAAAWLHESGLPLPHVLPALLLVGSGGGLGGLLFFFLGQPFPRCLDLATGLFPFLELLANPHFVAGTALLLWSLWVAARARGAAGHLLALLLASAMALVRPYDLVLFVAIRVLVVAVTAPPREWLARLAPLAGLAPVVAYNYWLFYRNPAFAFYQSAPYLFPETLDFVSALGPAAVVALAGALLAARGLRANVDARAARAHLLVWSLLGVAVIALRPVHFSLQFLVGLGLPLLALGALGLARFRPAVTGLVAVLLCTTAVSALWIVLAPNPSWFVPAPRLLAARALRESCRPGDVLLAPEDIGLYAAGLTSCRALVSHRIAPDYAERVAEVRAFFGAGEPGARAAYLDRNCVTHVTLPGGSGPVPREALGDDTPFRRVAEVGSPAIGLYAREGPSPCRSGRR